jgi:capsid protein
MAKTRKPAVKARKRASTAAKRDQRADAALKVFKQRYANLLATYDAARTSDEYKNIWANADQYDADSSHSRAVRHTLISRSRYEIGNNGFSDGIAQTSATDLIGLGPTLRMQTASEGFNRMVEREWYSWCKAVKFRRKLWCMAHAKHSDGEAFAILKLNPSVKHRIKLDVVLHEAEQCQTPYPPIDEPNHIDGMWFDQFGNAIAYEFLKQHPGNSRGISVDMTPVTVPADRVLHWFKLRRPGQHRAVPEMSSTLNVGAASRRWRESNLSAADKAAMMTMFLETNFTPDETAGVDPMSTLDIEKGMMTALPDGYKPFQLDAKFPTAGYAEFNKSLVNEQARPKSMPYNKAACDSSSYNYASGRLDHQTYYAALDVEREDCNDLALDPLFEVWFEIAVVTFGWLGGNPNAVGESAKAHIWDWPKHRVADVESEANANETKLTSGQISLNRLYADAGMDLADEIASWAAAFGVGEDEIKKRLLDITLPPPKQEAAKQPANETPEPASMAALAVMKRVNGNGAVHVN